MKRFLSLILVVTLVLGCASTSPVRFTQVDESYVPRPKGQDAEIVFRYDRIKRPHHVIGIIYAELGARASRANLDVLLVKKAREVGADGIMLVEYDVDADVYLGHHRAVVGHGPWKRIVIRPHKRVRVKKTAYGIAVVFE